MFQPSLQTHFNGLVDLDILRTIRGFGFRWCRMDAQTCDAAMLHTMVEDAEACDLVPLPIVYDLDRLRAVPQGLAVEWGNEPDGDILPSVAAANFKAACAVALEIGVDLWGLAISNLDRYSLRWMRLVLDALGGQWPEGMRGVTAHRYGDGTFDYAHDGFASRDAEVDALLELCQGLPYMITELGYSTYPVARVRHPLRPKRMRYLRPDLHLSEEQQAANIAREWDFWKRRDCRVPFLYQINDGAHADEGYGIRRFEDGALTDWKPAAYQVPHEETPMEGTIAITNATLFGPRPITGWLTGDFDGLSVKLTTPLAGSGDYPEGGPYLSIQPDSTYEGRASGGGGYESFTKQGSDLVCAYVHDGVQYVHVVPFKDLP